MTLDDSWSSGLSYAIIAIASVLASISAAAGYRWGRYLIGAHGFLVLALPTYCLLFAYLDKISLNAHDIIFVAVSIGVVGCVAALRWWCWCLHLYGAFLGITSSLFLLAIPAVMDSDPDIIMSDEIVFCAIGGGVLFFCIMQNFFEKAVMIISSASVGAFVLVMVFDSQVQTGLIKRFFKLVAKATRCSELFLVPIDDDDYTDGDSSEAYFLILAYLLLCAVLWFLQTFVTARTYWIRTANQDDPALFKEGEEDPETEGLLDSAAQPARAVNVADDDYVDEFFKGRR